jgi:hypothetical protein
MEDHTGAARAYLEYEQNSDYRQGVFNRASEDLIRSWRVHCPETVKRYREDLERYYDEGWAVQSFEIAIEDLEDAMLDECNERFRLAFLRVSELSNGFQVIQRIERGE